MRLSAMPVLAFAALASFAAPAAAQTLDLTQYRGKVVYLDFWASWCAPCKLSFPWLNEIQQEYGANGVVVIGVNVDHDKAAADAFLRETPAQFHILYDPKGAIAGKYPIEGMPTSFVIGKDGKVRSTHEGFEPSHENEYLRQLVSAVRAP